MFDHYIFRYLEDAHESMQTNHFKLNRCSIFFGLCIIKTLALTPSLGCLPLLWYVTYVTKKSLQISSCHVTITELKRLHNLNKLNLRL